MSARLSNRRLNRGPVPDSKIAEGPRVLSLQQPWAWAVSIGKKRVENRKWTTAYRGTIYIHASQKLNRDGVEWLRREARLSVPEEFVHGAIVAVAEIHAVVTKREAARFGKWFFGPYGFVLTNITALARPVATVGKLGLFRAPKTLQTRVERSLKASVKRAKRAGSH